MTDEPMRLRLVGGYYLTGLVWQTTAGTTFTCLSQRPYLPRATAGTHCMQGLQICILIIQKHTESLRWRSKIRKAEDCTLFRVCIGAKASVSFEVQALNSSTAGPPPNRPSREILLLLEAQVSAQPLARALLRGARGELIGDGDSV